VLVVVLQEAIKYVAATGHSGILSSITNRAQCYNTVMKLVILIQRDVG
jgi:hypothetical protein